MATKLKKDLMIKNLAKRYHLVTHLERALEGFDDPWTYTYKKKTKDDAWHPSGHCMPPPSELYDMATAPPSERELSSTMAKIFQCGHFWHQLLQHVVHHKLRFCDSNDIERRGSKMWGESLRMFKKENLYYGRHDQELVAIGAGALDDPSSLVRAWPDDPLGKYKVQPQSYHWVTGAADIAPCHIPNDGDYLIDFKSMSSQQFNQQGIPEWAAAKYEAQINIYLDLFDMERGIIVPIDRGSLEMKEFTFARNQPLIDWVYAKWEFVSSCIESGHRPTESNKKKTGDDDLFGDAPLTGPIAA